MIVFTLPDLFESVCVIEGGGGGGGGGGGEAVAISGWVNIFCMNQFLYIHHSLWCCGVAVCDFPFSVIYFDKHHQYM